MQQGAVLVLLHALPVLEARSHRGSSKITTNRWPGASSNRVHRMAAGPTHKIKTHDAPAPDAPAHITQGYTHTGLPNPEP
jgi:hypothetical protein